VKLRLRRLPVRRLAGPRRLASPIVNLMRFLGDPVRTLLDLPRYGDVVGLARGDASVICAFGAAHTRTVLSDPARFHHFAETPIALPPDSAAARLGSLNLTSQNGEVHRARRRALLPVFERAALASYRDAMAAEISRRPIVPGTTLDVFGAMTDLASAIAIRCLFGLEDQANRELGALGGEYLQRLVSPSTIVAAFDLPGLPFRRFLRVAEELERRVRELVAAGRDRGGRDVLSMLASQRELDDDEVIAQVALFFLAGYETTACTIAWTLFLLAQHPHELDLVAAQLAERLHGRIPEVDDLAGLDALDRVVHESMRLLPAAPLCFLRRAQTAFQLGDHALPEGALVITSALTAHRDPVRFAEPRRFAPARWRDLAPGPYEYLPFGAGPRRCIGAGFAAQAIRMVLATMLQRVRPVVADGTTVSRRVRGIVLGVRRDVAMRLEHPQATTRPARIRGDVHALVELGATVVA
jgi:cytochrome P450